MNGSEFIDLRLNRGQNDHNESFWPSFTDIMTVIVMIFLLAMIVLLLKNTELVQQLRQTLAAERAASEVAYEIGQDNEELSTQLAETRELVAQLQTVVEKLNARDRQRMATISTLENREQQLAASVDSLQQQVTDKESESRRLSDELAARSASLEALQASSDEQQQRLTNLREQLSSSRALTQEAQAALLVSEQANQEQADEIIAMQEAQQDLKRQTSDLNEQLEALTASLAQARSTLAETETQLSASEKTAESLQTDYQTQAEELLQARRLIAASEQSYTTLQGEFSDLKREYDKLFKPARSKKGKYIAKAVYIGDDTFQLSLPDGTSRTLGLAAAETFLQDISGEHCTDLYVQVVFPESEAISHAKAWRLTSRLHKYDYYFRESTCEE